MIGVAVQPNEQEAARELFELFKTPWEFCQPGRRYEVIIGTGSHGSNSDGRLTLVFNSRLTPLDLEIGTGCKPQEAPGQIVCGTQEAPVYGQLASFSVSPFSGLRRKDTGKPVAFLNRRGEKLTLRVGYNLFDEIRYLLTAGQPAANGGFATLEFHIDLLRKLITGAGLPLAEIPPVPHGHRLIACLTHDLDHPSLRNHWCDHTMFGFLGRATVGSLMNVCRGRKPVNALWQNWAAVGKLPLMYCGMTEDPWRGFDRYLDIESGLGSTYFVIPKGDYAGRKAKGMGPSRRAARYEPDQIKPQLGRIRSAGCEVALHGIDAWLDSASGDSERQRVFGDNGERGEVGVRMHWLYFNEDSPSVLERAGFSYDSTFGYNETVGYRAGTSQAYKPFGAGKLLELPLNVMDTALFYPNYLNLSEAEARQRVWRLIDGAEKFGGALTINWHDRSIAPERLWDGFYLELLKELKDRQAWFPTAARAVAWFRKRRSARFESCGQPDRPARFKICFEDDGATPGLRVRIHKPKKPEPNLLLDAACGYEDRDCGAGQEISVTF